MEKTVDATLARRQLGTLLDEVYYKGESIVIERKGKPLAKIVPLNDSAATEKKGITPQQRRLIDELHSLPTMEIDEDPTDILTKIREKKAYFARKKYGK